MKKSGLAALVCLCLWFLLPCAAMAAGTLVVGGRPVALDRDYKDFDLSTLGIGTGRIDYEMATQTLTLKGVAVTTNEDFALAFEGQDMDVTVKLVGDNSVSAKVHAVAFNEGSGDSDNCTLTITGPGGLDASSTGTGGEDFSIVSHAPLTVTGGAKVTAVAHAGIAVFDQQLTIKGASEVSVAADAGIRAALFARDIVIEEKSVVNVTSGKTTAVWARDITITDSRLNAYGDVGGLVADLGRLLVQRSVLDIGSNENAALSVYTHPAKFVDTVATFVSETGTAAEIFEQTVITGTSDVTFYGQVELRRNADGAGYLHVGPKASVLVGTDMDSAQHFAHVPSGLQSPFKEMTKIEQDAAAAIGEYAYVHITTAPAPKKVALPATGDSSSLALWMALTALAAAGFALSRRTARG